MAVFTQGGEWLLKNGTIFLYGETYISLDISMSRCTISLCVSIKGQQRSWWSLFRTFPWWTWPKNKNKMHSYLLAKFTKCFRQVQQVKVLNKDQEDLCWRFIDKYKLAVYHQYSYLVKYWSRRRKNCPTGRMTHKEWNNFFYCLTSISLNIGRLMYTISLYISIKGRQRFSWSLFETLTC